MISAADSNNATKRFSKMDAAPQSLWGEEPIILHQIMEVHFSGGAEEVYCTAAPYRPDSGGKWMNYAGYVGFPTLPEDCPLCTGKGDVEQLRAGQHDEEEVA